MPLFYEDDKVRLFKPPCGPYDNNSYLVVCAKTNEGVIIDAPMEPAELLEEAAGIEVQAILITHGHQDHLAGLQEIRVATNAPVGAHVADPNSISSGLDFYVEDGALIKFGMLALEAIYTPGHTDGSVCYLYTGHLFSGDTLFPGGPGKSKSPEKLREIILSITEKLFVLPDDIFLLPGHGKHSTIGVSKQEYSVFDSKSHPTDLSGDVLWLES